MENYERIPMINQPRELMIDLYPHQLASVYRMEEIEREKKIVIDDTRIIETSIGINGDITGYGKSMSMVTLVLRDKMNWDISEPYTTETMNSYSGGKIIKKFRDYHERINSTLVLVGQSLVKQWQNEFARTSSLCVETVTSKKHIDEVDAEVCDVVIVVPSLFNRLIERYHNVAWKRFIYDEPGHIKVPSMRRVLAGFMWFVTATPNAILTMHHNCRGSFMHGIIGQNNWVNYVGIFREITVANDEKFIQASFEMPVTHHIHHHCFSGLYRTLHGIVSDRILSMIDANNMQGAISALGGKKIKNIAELVRKKKEEELEEINSKIRIYRLRDDEKKAEEWMVRKKAVEGNISELDRRYNELLNEPCNICCCSLINPVMEPLCQNIYCARCLLTWLKNKETCPLCRRVVKLDELVYITTDGSDEKKEEEKRYSKEEKILELIKNKENGRFIVFSSHCETFEKICNVFTENKISYIEVKGTISIIANKINDFKQGIIRVAFLNSKHQGTGLNLQEATDIIVYHKMDPDSIRQIIGRANRIGRTEPLTVHHLIYK